MLKPFDKFVIFGHARSGTSTLTSIIKSQDINIIGEPFNKEVTNFFINKMNENGLEYSLKEIEKKYLGFKHLFFQLNKFQNEIIVKKFKTILIYRRNLLEAAISAEVAMQTKIWDYNDLEIKKELYHNVNFLDVEKLKKTYNEFSNDLFIYKNMCSKHLQVCYEDLYESNESQKIELIQEIFEYLKIKIIDLDKIKFLLSPENKLNKKKWSEILINWDDIKKIT